MTTKTKPYDGQIDSLLLNKAVQALIKYHASTGETKAKETNKEQLLGDETAIYVQIGLSKCPENPSPCPIRIMIPHPFYKSNDYFGYDETGIEGLNICIIVKDDSKPFVQNIIENFPKQMGCVKKVLTLDSLRRKYHQFQQRRELLAKYDLFLGDSRIIPMLSKPLGKQFYKAKKLPIPIDIRREKALPFVVERAVKSTHMRIPAGTCLAIRAGNTAMPIDHIVENCEAIVKKAAEKIPNGWLNIANIFINTVESVALPIYNKSPEERIFIHRLAGIPLDDKRPKRKEDGKLEKEEKMKKRRKKEHAAKSPLVRALKKQQAVADENEKTSTDDEVQQPDRDEGTEDSARKKRKKGKEEVLRKKSNEKEADEQEEENASKPSKKSKTEELKSSSNTTPKTPKPEKDEDTAKSKLKEKDVSSSDKHEDDMEEQAPMITPKEKKSSKKSKKSAKKEKSKKESNEKLEEEVTPKSSKKSKTENVTPITESDDPSSENNKQADLSNKSQGKDIPSDDKDETIAEQIPITPKEKKSSKKSKKSSKKDSSSKKETEKNDEAEEKVVTPKEKTSSGKQSKDEAENSKTVEKASIRKKEEVEDEKEPFVASKKFKGSKPGYVFRKGEKGAGYYVDLVPTPDKVALSKWMRSSTPNRRSSRNKKSPKSSARRKGRR